MKKILSTAAVLIFLLTALNCEDQRKIEMKEVKIVFSGLVAADGCGWLLEIDGEDYSPINLKEEYQKGGLLVKMKIKYLKTGFQCGMNPDFKVPQVEILHIEELQD